MAIPFFEVQQLMLKRGFELLSLESEYKGITSILRFNCSKHGEMKTRFSAFKYSQYGCKKCGQDSRAVDRKHSIDFIKQRIIERGYLIDPDFVWKGVSGKITFICPKHGLKSMDWRNFLSGSNCFDCAVESNSNRVLAKTNWKEKLDKILEEKDLELIEAPEILKTSAKITVRCKKDGYTWKTSPNWLQSQKYGCKRCTGLEKLTEIRVKELATSIGYKIVGKIPTKLNTQTSIEVICTKGHKSKTTGNIMQRHNGCKYCAGIAVYPEEFLERIDSLGFNTESIYTSLDTPLNLTCKKGHTFEKSYRAVWHDVTKCPKCDPPYTSKQENEIADWLKTFMPENEIERNDRKLLSNHEIDILIPSKNLGIEFNGIYYHNEISFLKSGKTLKQAKAYHQSKYIRAKNKNVQLITIWDYEWKERKLAVQSRIKSLLGYNTIRIGARNTIVRKLDKTEWPLAKKFLETYHVQSSALFKYAYGLFYKGDLVSVMTFSKPHRQNMRASLVLNRFCVKYDVTIKGGASKLFTFAKAELQQPILSYSDNRCHLEKFMKF